MVMAALTLLVLLSTVFQRSRVPVSISVSGISLVNVIMHERCHPMDLIAGPGITAPAVSLSQTLNQVVLWDKILQRGENPRLNLHDMSPKYLFLDDGNGLQGNKNVSLSLSWNIVPNAGILYLIPASGQKLMPLPENYEDFRSD
ncbi:signal peptidase complex subunit 3-like isoform X2 [Carcharodon carcharias]|uniref:signal peptidase complex subunit 3-like isoform X2 n=1 Tax=Carcharodon carcharias TaxID=13397 RepID=UPI001B7E610D|nr:signal peptidase complex subunit 3-like isoform X2 [Carcharodon carcharias]